MTKTVRVQFTVNGYTGEYANRTYDYFVTDADAAKLKKGSHVVVHNGQAFSIARLQQDVLDGPGAATKFIVQPIDSEAYFERVEREKKADAIEAALKARVKRAKELRQIAEAVDGDIEGQAMLAELKALRAA